MGLKGALVSDVSSRTSHRVSKVSSRSSRLDRVVSNVSSQTSRLRRRSHDAEEIDELKRVGYADPQSILVRALSVAC